MISQDEIDDINDDLEHLFHMGTIDAEAYESTEETMRETLESIVQQCTDLANKVAAILEKQDDQTGKD